MVTVADTVLPAAGEVIVSVVEDLFTRAADFAAAKPSPAAPANTVTPSHNHHSIRPVLPITTSRATRCVRQSQTLTDAPFRPRLPRSAVSHQSGRGNQIRSPSYATIALSYSLIIRCKTRQGILRCIHTSGVTRVTKWVLTTASACLAACATLSSPRSEKRRSPGLCRRYTPAPSRDRRAPAPAIWRRESGARFQPTVRLE